MNFFTVLLLAILASTSLAILNGESGFCHTPLCSPEVTELSAGESSALGRPLLNPCNVLSGDA